jgi:hypothetical protein
MVWRGAQNDGAGAVWIREGNADDRNAGVECEGVRREARRSRMDTRFRWFTLFNINGLR